MPLGLETEPPSAVRCAVGFWIATVVLGILTSVVGFATGFFTVTGTGSSPEIATFVRGLVAALVALISLTWWALEVLLAFRLRAGRRRARPWLIVLGVLTAVLNVIFGVGAPAGIVLLLLAQTGTLAVAVILMYSSAASGFVGHGPGLRYVSVADAPPDDPIGPPPAGRGPAAPTPAPTRWSRRRSRRGPLDL